jgi:hypothetical protein
MSTKNTTNSQSAKFEFRKRSEDKDHNIDYWHEYYILGETSMPMDADRADFIVAHDEKVIFTQYWEPEEIAAELPECEQYEVKYLSGAQMQYMTEFGYSQFLVARMQGTI